MGWDSGAGVSFASVALLSRFTQYPRAASHKLPQEEKHQAKHTMPPAMTGRVIGFLQFSDPFWEGFLLTIKLGFTNGEHFTASLWSYCLLAEEEYCCEV